MANIIELLIKGSAKGAINSLKETKDTTRATRIEISLMIDNLTQLGMSLKKVTDFSDEYNASMRLLNISFGKATKQAVAFRNKLADITGLDETLLNKQIAKFDILGKSFNLTNEYAEKFSKNLTILSNKLAMLYNVDASVMAQSVQNAIQGTQTTLRSMTGIEATELAEQAILLEKGIDRTVSSLNDAEQGILRYYAILQRVTNETKVYEGAVNSLGWQKQVFTAQVRRLATAIGQFLSPAFNNLLIIVNAVLMVLTELIKIIASFFNISIDLDATTDGLSDGYEQLGNSIAKAGSSAKKSLRSFDKLNNITTPSSGGGAGAKNLGIDNSILKLLDGVDNTFDKIRNKATEIRDQIMAWLGFTKDVNGEWKWSSDTLLKNIWNWWKDLNVLGKIFVGLGIVVVLTSIFRLLKNIASAAILRTIKLLTTTFGKFSGVLGGIALSGGGLAMLISGVQKIKEEGANFNNVLEVIVGTLGLVAGAIVLVTTLTGTLSVTMALVTGGIALLIAGIVGLIAWFSSQNEKTKETNAVLAEYEKKIKEVKDAQKEEKQILEAKVGRVQVLKNELKGLVDENGRVTGSEEEVGAKLHELNKLLGTEYKVTKGVITINGKKIKSYDELSDSVEEYCTQLKAQGLLEIAQEEYNARLREHIELQKEKNRRMNELIESQKNYNITTQEGYQRWYQDNSRQIEELRKTNRAFEENSYYLDNYSKASYEASVGNYQRAEELLIATFKNVGATTQATLDEINNKAQLVPQVVQNALNKITWQRPKVDIDVQLHVNDPQGQMQSLLQNKMGLTNNNLNFTTRLRAEGGFVDQGELFVAREAGPELVGNINGHTAVANNDQIVKGIQSGVFSGMMSALQNTDFNSNVTIEAKEDTDGLLNFITFKQVQKQRQFN